jgi:hypothetical protein
MTNKYFFIPTKQSYSKHVERIDVWKKVWEGEKAWANKVGLVTLLDIKWKELNHGALIEFLIKHFCD